jgi:hypothetical protein
MYFSAGSVTDIYYIINKNPGNTQKSRDAKDFKNAPVPAVTPEELIQIAAG